MGTVFKARDDTLNRFVAIKELRVDPGSSPQVPAQVQQQFLQEAQVLAVMNHPNLPRVTDYFAIGANEYLVMDFIEGRNLAGMLAQGGGRPIDEAQVLNWARQMLDALASAKPKPLSPRTQHHARTVLRTALAWGERNGRIGRNVAKLSTDTLLHRSIRWGRPCASLWRRHDQSPVALHRPE